MLIIIIIIFKYYPLAAAFQKQCVVSIVKKLCIPGEVTISPPLPHTCEHKQNTFITPTPPVAMRQAKTFHMVQKVCRKTKLRALIASSLYSFHTSPRYAIVLCGASINASDLVVGMLFKVMSLSHGIWTTKVCVARMAILTDTAGPSFYQAGLVRGSLQEHTLKKKSGGRRPLAQR